MRRLLPLLGVLLAAGCAGYLRPLPAADGESLFLVLSGKRLSSRDAETQIHVPDPDAPGGWRQLATLSGAARSTAAWQGRLWIVYRDNCSAYRLTPEGLKRDRVCGFRPDWSPSELAVHRGALWSLGISDRGDTRMLSAWRLASPEGDWEPLGEQLDLGRSTGSFDVAASRDSLWVLWRKRDANGRLLPETLSACRRDGTWHTGPARAAGGSELLVCGRPDADGVLVFSARRSTSGREIAISRLSLREWTEPISSGIRPREFGSAVLRLGIISRPAPESPDRSQLLLFAGRRAGVAVLSASPRQDEALTAWREESIAPVSMLGLETMLSVLLLFAAAAFGSGLALATVRRKRLFPLMPGQPRPAPIYARAGAWMADNLLVGLLFYLVPIMAGQPLYQVMRHVLLFPLMLGAYRLVYCFYAAIFEARLGTTPGKLLFGLRVAMTDGHRPTTRAALLRNALRVLDEALIFPLPGLIMIIISRHAQRLGDIFAGTVVSTSRSLEEIAEDRRRKSDRFGRP